MAGRTPTEQSAGLDGDKDKRQPVEPAPTSKLKARRETENLGWLAESTLMPKKQRVIEGVGAASLVDLKAQLYRTQEQVKRQQAGLVDSEEKRKCSGFKVERLLDKQNAGVAARNARDLEQTQTTKDKMSECYAALEKKAALYEKIARGEMLDSEELYNVDFVRKGYLEGEPAPTASTSAAPEHEPNNWGRDGTSQMMSRDMEVAREREGWEEETRRNAAEEAARESTRRERQAAIAEINQETVDSRDRQQSLKDRRQAQAEKNRNQLRAAFLAKQVQKLKQLQTAKGGSGTPAVAANKMGDAGSGATS